MFHKGLILCVLLACGATFSSCSSMGNTQNAYGADTASNRYAQAAVGGDLALQHQRLNVAQHQLAVEAQAEENRNRSTENWTSNANGYLGAARNTQGFIQGIYRGW